ncbi:membrane protein [Cystoisospora suis]|uniref:Membrane protein n=1 Tax=Cystoisospora suis TaxID=483139 RepID=A0A2C6LC92_9APIC|nr:membrane protein [Cystoisospora suis]
MATGRRLISSSKWTRWIWKIRLSWRVHRHSWRILFYYNVLAGCCAVGIVLTFILHALTSNASFFTNYRCGAVAKSLIRANFVAVMVTAGVMGLAALLTSRIIALFISHTLGELKPTGHWMDRIGFVVKWVPWFISLCLLVLICICTINLAWILLDAKSWCSRRWSARGLQAVRNCRAWFGGTAVCLTTGKALKPRKIS